VGSAAPPVRGWGCRLSSHCRCCPPCPAARARPLRHPRPAGARGCLLPRGRCSPRPARSRPAWAPAKAAGTTRSWLPSCRLPRRRHAVYAAAPCDGPAASWPGRSSSAPAGRQRRRRPARRQLWLPGRTPSIGPRPSRPSARPAAARARWPCPTQSAAPSAASGVLHRHRASAPAPQWPAAMVSAGQRRAVAVPAWAECRGEHTRHCLGTRKRAVVESRLTCRPSRCACVSCVICAKHACAARSFSSHCRSLSCQANRSTGSAYTMTSMRSTGICNARTMVLPAGPECDQQCEQSTALALDTTGGGR
jgi:hypothetical protein